MEEASAWTVRLDPFAIQDELRDSSLAHVTDNLVRGAGAGLDVDLGIGDLVFFEESSWLRGNRGTMEQNKATEASPIIPTAPFLRPWQFQVRRRVPTTALAILRRQFFERQARLHPPATKQWKRTKFIPRTLGRTWGTPTWRGICVFFLSQVRRSRKNVRSNSPLSSASSPLVTSIW